MLTRKKIYNINEGRAKHSTDSGKTAPESLGDFFISDLLRECREYKTPLKGEIISDDCLRLFSSRNLDGIKGTFKQEQTDMNNLTFNNQHIELVNVNNQPYMTLHQIGEALGYAQSRRLSGLFMQHADEFTPEMSMLIKQGRTQVRVFSLRGCHLLAMFSKTQVAKEFRKWVLDLIESHNQAISKMETPAFDMKAIGGMVKKCCAVAVKEELERQALSPMLPFNGETDDTIKNLVSALLTNIINGRVESSCAEIIAENKELKEKVNQIKSIATSKAITRRAA